MMFRHEDTPIEKVYRRIWEVDMIQRGSTAKEIALDTQLTFAEVNKALEELCTREYIIENYKIQNLSGGKGGWVIRR